MCGWWYAIERADGWANSGDPLAYHGILRSFDLRSSSIPMEVLRSELPRQLDKIGYLHPNRMEDLVAEVLRGAFDCEVRSLGYTKDGGVDLLVLLSDDPVAVQVKRRQRRNATEGVEGVREFLGAALLKGHHRLLYVSTADHYSADAGAAARRAKDCGLVNSYELVDIHVLRELLNSRPAELNWMMALKQAVQRGFTMVKTPDPYEFR
jgi:restriction endonuclease Mrr